MRKLRTASLKLSTELDANMLIASTYFTMVSSGNELMVFKFTKERPQEAVKTKTLESTSKPITGMHRFPEFLLGFPAGFDLTS